MIGDAYVPNVLVSYVHTCYVTWYSTGKVYVSVPVLYVFR